MNKKIILTTLMASVLSLNLSYTVLAAPASTNTVVTGRTEQNNQTGVIKPEEIQTPIYHNVTSEITLKGTVIIDGPSLVFTVTDPDGNSVSSDKISIVKIADKTYTYSVKVNPSKYKGNVDFKLNAKTIYINGKAAGQTHTSAPEQTKSIHVAYVSGFEYSLNWGTYDRTNNKYPYSYELTKVWDDGTKVKVADTLTGAILGTEEVSIIGEDPTYDGDTNIGTEIPPVNIHSFSVGKSTWTYNEETKKYDLSFDLIKDLSNGGEERVPIVKNDIAPSADYVYTANDSRSSDYTIDFPFTAPAAPKQAEPTVPSTPEKADPVLDSKSISVTNITSLWTGNEGIGGNVQERYTLKYSIDGKEYSHDLSNNFTKKGTGFVDQKLNYVETVEGKDITVEYVLPYIEPKSKDNNTTTM